MLALQVLGNVFGFLAGIVLTIVLYFVLVFVSGYDGKLSMTVAICVGHTFRRNFQSGQYQSVKQSI